MAILRAVFLFDNKKKLSAYGANFDLMHAGTFDSLRVCVVKIFSFFRLHLRIIRVRNLH